MKKKQKTNNTICPNCKKKSMSLFTPFCSKKCSEIDLLKWLTEGSKENSTKNNETYH